MYSGRHRRFISDAASAVIAVADDLGVSLVDVIAEMERFIVEETKVGDAAVVPVDEGQRGYTLKDGRLVEISN